MHKKAVVVGGSNGIGLAISRELVGRGYHIEIIDKNTPEEGLLVVGTYRYHSCDLFFPDWSLFESLADDPDVSALMITAGIGRIADFQYHHQAEIDKILRIDTVSTIRIFRIFYDRIMNAPCFYAGVMGSISGWMSTPRAAVYAAAKAAVVRFVESVNIELEAYGSANRILDVSPSAFKGSRFYGGENDLSMLQPLAVEIVKHLFAKDALFIPEYDTLFGKILEQYHEDPHSYGLYSFNYKAKSGRLDNSRRVVIGYLSGTFDLFHIGHLNLLKRARAQCDYLIVGVHESGAWKGKETFIPFDERRQILEACSYVDKVVEAPVEDSDAWGLFHYDRLFVGSDYQGTERFQKYEAYFSDKNVEIIYFPYTQSTSSTQIRRAVLDRTDLTVNKNVN